MEVEDCNYPLLDGCIATLSSEEAFRDADVAVLLGGFPRLQGMERKELIVKNAEGMQEQAKAMEKFSKPSVKCVVVANPANTNCLVAMRSAPSLPAENFTCLTRLDEERLRGFVLQKSRERGISGVVPGRIKGLAIWGNHSTTQIPYIDNAVIETADAKKVAVSDLFSTAAERDDLVSRVQNRGAAIIKKQQASSGLSAANAIASHLTDWLAVPSSSAAADKVFSMGILSTGNPYGIPDGLVYSFPLRRRADGVVEIVPDLPISEQVRAMLNASVDELQSERKDAETLVGDLGLGVFAPSRL